MIINPRLVLEKGWVRFKDENINVEKFVQPNALDFTVDSLYNLSENMFTITADDKKTHRGGSPVQPDSEGYWRIYRGAYDFASSMYVEVPEGIAAWMIVRSTFNRNGIFITSGLYDSGFKGPIAGMLHNRGSEARIQPGTRLGQIIFADSDSAKQYAGGYNTEQGKHWSDK